MAGFPVRQALGAALEADGGIDRVCERLVEGESLSKIAKSYDRSRQLLYKWLDAEPDRRQKIGIAKRYAAEGMIDDAMDDVETETDTRASGLLQARTKFRQWLAGKWNVEFADKAQAAMTINVEELHLQAVQSAPDRPVLDDRTKVEVLAPVSADGGSGGIWPD